MPEWKLGGRRHRLPHNRFGILPRRLSIRPVLGFGHPLPRPIPRPTATPIIDSETIIFRRACGGHTNMSWQVFAAGLSAVHADTAVLTAWRGGLGDAVVTCRALVSERFRRIPWCGAQFVVIASALDGTATGIPHRARPQPVWDSVTRRTTTRGPPRAIRGTRVGGFGWDVTVRPAARQAFRCAVAGVDRPGAPCSYRWICDDVTVVVLFGCRVRIPGGPAVPLVRWARRGSSAPRRRLRTPSVVLRDRFPRRRRHGVVRRRRAETRRSRCCRGRPLPS